MKYNSNTKSILLTLLKQSYIYTIITIYCKHYGPTCICIYSFDFVSTESFRNFQLLIVGNDLKHLYTNSKKYIINRYFSQSVMKLFKEAILLNMYAQQTIEEQNHVTFTQQLFCISNVNNMAISCACILSCFFGSFLQNT